MEPWKKFFVEKLFLKKIFVENFFTKNFCVAKVFLRKKFPKEIFSLGLREKESCPTATDQWSPLSGSPSLSFTLAHRSHVLPPKLSITFFKKKKVIASSLTFSASPIG